MSATLERLKQQSEQQPASQSTEATERLAQAIETLAQRQAETEETLREMHQRLTSQQSGSTPGSSGNFEKRLSEIEKTLSVLAENLNGDALTTASEGQAKTAARLEKIAASVSKEATALTAESQAVQKRVVVAAEKHMGDYAKKLATFVEAREKEAAERTERAIAVATSLDQKAAWSAFAAIALGLLPIAGTVLAFLILATSFIGGWQWALAAGWETARWTTIGRVLLLGLGTIGALGALTYAVRWVAGLVGDWKVKGVPRWPWEKP